MTQAAVAAAPGLAPGEPDARPPAGAPPDGNAPRRWHVAALVAGLTALVGLPAAVALAVVRTPTWHPSVDYALIEMRVRDVATQYNPVLGAGGRFTAFGEQGNHPGPLPYYVLAPAYRLFGSTSWALEVAAVSVSLAAVAVGVWLAHRRAGTIGALAAALGYLVLVLLYQPLALLSPWNPAVAMLWWVTLLLSLWGVLCRDYVLLPVTAFAAALCAQAHVSYLGLAGGLAIAVGAFVAVDVVRNPPLRRPLVRWLLIGVLVELVLWGPPLYEQFQVGTGNLTIMWDSFTDPQEDPITFAAAWDLIISHLDLTPAFRDGGDPTGPAWTLLVLWALSVAGAVWLRRPWLSRLHVITAAAMATSFITVLRITGMPWPYLVLWARGTAVLAAATTVVTAMAVGATLWRRRAPAPAEPAEAAGSDDADEPAGADDADEAAASAEVQESAGAGDARRADLATADESRAERTARRRAQAAGLRIRPHGPPPGAFRRLVLGLSIAIAVALVPGVIDGANASGLDRGLSRTVEALVEPTERALDDDGPRNRETVLTFTDPVSLGSTGFALMLALERHGYDVRAFDAWQSAVGDRRLTTIEDAERQVHVSVGDGDIARWRSDDRMREVAHVDPRTDEERAEVREEEAAIVAELEERGLHEKAREVQSVRLLALTDPEIPDDVKQMIYELGDFPQPVSVFLSSRPGAVPENPAPAAPAAGTTG